MIRKQVCLVAVVLGALLAVRRSPRRRYRRGGRRARVLLRGLPAAWPSRSACRRSQRGIDRPRPACRSALSGGTPAQQRERVDDLVGIWICSRVRCSPRSPSSSGHSQAELDREQNVELFLPAPRSTYCSKAPSSPRLARTAPDPSSHSRLNIWLVAGFTAVVVIFFPNASDSTGPNVPDCFSPQEFSRWRLPPRSGSARSCSVR